MRKKGKQSTNLYQREFGVWKNTLYMLRKIWQYRVASAIPVHGDSPTSFYEADDAEKESLKGLLVRHRLSSCKFCDRIAVFSDGRIVEYGTHEKLASMSGGLYVEMFEAQAQYYR